MSAELAAVGPTKVAIVRQVAAGAPIMFANPRRIVRAVYSAPFPTWPWKGKSVATVLADCRAAIADREEAGRTGHWTYDHNTLVAARQAEAALLQMLAEEAAAA